MKTSHTGARRSAQQRKRITKRKWIITGIITAMAIIIGTALLWWRIGASGNTTKLVADVSAPGVMEFSDDATMFFATPTSIPEPNNARTIRTPDAVTISYIHEQGPFAPAFRMDLGPDDLSDRIKITPFIRGTWSLRGDSTLVFRPDDAWPADTRFSVKIDAGLFADDVHVDSKRIAFTTPPITAHVDNFNLYPNPDDKKSVIAVAVIEFDYAINPTDFNDRISLKLDGEYVDFRTEFDRFHRTAFIISAPIQITDDARALRLKLNRVPAMAGDARTEKITAHVTVESADNMFKITSLETNIADDNDGNSRQLILLNTTATAASSVKWDEYITAYLLPKYRDGDASGDAPSHTWQNDEITDTVLQESQKLDLTQLDFATPNGVHQYAFAYNVSEPDTRYIYVSVAPGARSASDFIMRNGLAQVMRVPYPPESVEIAGRGALLSLGGDKTLGIVARGGVDTAYVNLYKIKSSEINHLISQTYDVFSSAMEFKSWAFGVYDMSTVFQKRISFANPSMTRANYASIDLGDYLDRTYGDNTGIFVIQTGTSENSAEYNDKRLILLTDMGIIRKVNSDESSSVFVSNLSGGTPAPDVKISVLGRNGTAIWAGRTDASGRVQIPSFPWSEYRNAQEPVAIVARQNDDVSFIPFNAYNQRVEYSKFDVDGTYAASMTPMNAFLFTDRGIYRPGETMVIGGIVKEKSFASLAGVPVKIELRDVRGRLALERTISLTSDGMFDVSYAIPENAPLGTWWVHVYSLNSRDTVQDMLGNTSFDVQEFVPDTMKITANITGDNDNGWIATNDLVANVSLRNLFGTPATNRRISARATLTPIQYSFPEYSGYTFTPNFIPDDALATRTATAGQTFSVELPDATTDDNGAAILDVKFNNVIPMGTYALTMNIRGYDAGAGTSVQTNISTRVSDAKFLVGYKTSSDLSYINRNANHTVNLVALAADGTKTDAPDLTLRLMRRENQTTLVKDYNNFYKYQTVTNDKLVSQSTLDITSDGTDIKLDTSNGGTYFLQISDASGKILANIKYFVAGANTTLAPDTNAELQIKLDTTEYAPGDDIAVSITAPYTGTGLITIERDRVYAYQWFNTDTTSSVQHIKLPRDFAGTGYVNVSFVRDINSRDVFTSPYTYAVAPFSANTSAHEIKIKLDVPETVTDNKLEIKYTANKSGRMMLFAINTGILQVAKYQIPNPLAYFFQKSALQVNTYQILSLLLPEYNILRQYAKTGGGDYGGESGALDQITANPFGRQTLPPVAFYSKILDVHANTPGTVVFDIPEYFNGEVSVFAVAARNDAIGSADTKTLVQSPLVISTSAPLAVAPGDSFKINSVITNMTGADTPVSVSTTGGDRIKIANSDASSEIATDTEHLFTFDAHATQILGNATITTLATATPTDNDVIQRQNTVTLSVRPTSQFETHIKIGAIDSEKTRIRDFAPDMYPEFATRHLYISRGASAMIRPLYMYLSDYEWPCTEQLVSRAIPYALFPDDAVLGTTFDTSATHITETINMLKNRQNDDGSFSLWPGSDSVTTMSGPDTAYLTAYVAQFLTIARDAGFTIAPQMLSRALDYLRSFAGGTITDDAYAAAVAYAIYVISENEYVTTSYIDTFIQYADEHIPDWPTRLAGAYIAASYKILHQDSQADRLIAEYAPSRPQRFEYTSMFDNNVANDAMYHYLGAKYFNIAAMNNSDTMQQYINAGDYSAYTSAAIIMALSGNQTSDTADVPEISVTTNDGDIDIPHDTDNILVDIPSGATRIDIACPECTDTSPLYYATLVQGYPTHTDTHSDGIEIIREYFDASGDRITSGSIGDIVTVKISARTRGGTDTVSNVVITDLLPGGIIATPGTITGDAEFTEIREDRVLIYTTLYRTPREFTYTGQLGAVGEFAIAPIAAQSMYNAQIRATGRDGTFTVYDVSK